VLAGRCNVDEVSRRHASAAWQALKEKDDTKTQESEIGGRN
jgi:hypothetical protein